MAITVAQLAVKIQAEGATETKDALKGVGDQTDQTHGLLAKLAGGALVLGAVKDAGGLLFDQVKDIADVTGKHLDIQAQLNAVLKSTGDVSGLSAQQVDALSESLSKQTTFSADTITKTQDLLLTFTNIGGKAMPDATKATLDLATAMGEDTSSAAVQLGKALNDPEHGMTALQRVGVTFTASQKDSIKAMQAHGDMAGAQSVILKELQKEFGGSAVAAGATLPGALARAHNSFEELQIKIGTKVAPVISDLVEKHLAPLAEMIADKVSYVVDHATEIWNKWWPVIVIVGGAIGGALVAALVAATIAAWSFLVPILIAAAPFIAIGVAIAAVIVGVKLLIDHWSQLTDWFSHTDFGKGVIGVFNDIKDVVEKIIKGVGDLLGKLGAIKDAIGGGLGKIGGLLGGLHLPGFASGTDYAPGGLAIVGEHGPELVNLPSGSQVIPLPYSATSSGGGGGSPTLASTFIIQLDGRTIAQSTATHLPGIIRLATSIKI
jgi:hypothetical protein